MNVFVLAGFLLAQYTGNTAANQELQIRDIEPIFSFQPLPAAALSGVAPAPFAAMTYERIPATTGAHRPCWTSGPQDTGGSAELHTPPNYRLDTAFGGKISGFPNSSGTGNVVIYTDCSFTADGDVVPAATSTKHVIAMPGVAYQQLSYDMGAFPSVDNLTGGVFCDIWRDVSDTDDTYAGNFCLFQIVGTYQISRVGNDTSAFEP